MFNLDSPIMQSLIKSQLKKLKKVKIELKSEKDNSKSCYQIKDQDIKSGEACFTLEDIDTGEISYMNVRL